MAILDVETIVKKTQELIKSKLNDQIDCITAEKNDWEIEKINDDAWYFQQLGDEVYSYPSFIVWGIYSNPSVTDDAYSNSMKKVTMFFEVVIPDSGGPISENVFYKLLRYTRALETVVQKNYDKVHSGIKVKVSQLNPTSFSTNNETFRSAGIEVEAAISTR